jgi:hypothetical protein
MWGVNYLRFCQSLIKRNLVNSCLSAMQCIMSLPLFSPNMVSRRLKATSKEVIACLVWWWWWFLWMLCTVLRRPTCSTFDSCSFNKPLLAPRRSCNSFVTCIASLTFSFLSSDWQENKTQSFNTSLWNKMHVYCEVVTGKWTIQLSVLFLTAASHTFL